MSINIVNVLNYVFDYTSFEYLDLLNKEKNMSKSEETSLEIKFIANSLLRFKF